MIRNRDFILKKDLCLSLFFHHLIHIKFICFTIILYINFTLLHFIKTEKNVIRTPGTFVSLKDCLKSCASQKLASKLKSSSNEDSLITSATPFTVFISRRELITSSTFFCLREKRMWLIFLVWLAKFDVASQLLNWKVFYIFIYQTRLFFTVNHNLYFL